jgi:two-component system chemotaxis response regulator CheY
MAKRVVFVDDSRTVLASVEVALEDLSRAGIVSVQTFDSPVEFLNLVQSGEFDYDLMFVDINMPEMTGIELVGHVKQIEKYAQKPVLVLTTESSDEMKSEGKRLGVTGWVQKPFSDAKIVKAVQKVLGV